MKTSNLSHHLPFYTFLVLLLTLLPGSPAIAGAKNQVSISYASEFPWQLSELPFKNFRTTKISNCTAQVKPPFRKARKHKIGCYKFK